MSIRAIEPLDPALRHAVTPIDMGTTQYYEWWYFEVDFIDDQGRPFRIITSIHYPHALDARRVLAREGVPRFQKFGYDPRDYAGVASYVVDLRESRDVALLISRVRRPLSETKVHVSRPGYPVDLTIGGTSFRQNDDGSYTLRVVQDGRRPISKRRLQLEMVAHFEQHTPGFQPKDGVLLEQGGVQHGWACVMPNPVVRIEQVLVREWKRGRTGDEITLCKGSKGAASLGGYHDHQWGADFFYKQIERWSWGRVPLTSDANASKVLFFDVVGRDGARPDPIVVEIPAGTTDPRALTPIPDRRPFETSDPTERMNLADGCKLAIYGQGIPYWRWTMLNGRDASGTPHDLRLEHTNGNNVDTWPFYLRFVPDAQVGGKTVSTISEIMQASRLELDQTHRILALSNSVTVDEG